MKSCSGKPCNEQGDCEHCNQADGKEIIDIEHSCKNCKTGKAQLDNFHNLRTLKTISFPIYLVRGKDLGQICFCCIHNHIGGKKAKKYIKKAKFFKSVDRFEPIVGHIR